MKAATDIFGQSKRIDIGQRMYVSDTFDAFDSLVHEDNNDC